MRAYRQLWGAGSRVAQSERLSPPLTLEWAYSSSNLGFFVLVAEEGQVIAWSSSGLAALDADGHLLWRKEGDYSGGIVIAADTVLVGVQDQSADPSSRGMLYLEEVAAGSGEVLRRRPFRYRLEGLMESGRLVGLEEVPPPDQDYARGTFRAVVACIDPSAEEPLWEAPSTGCFDEVFQREVAVAGGLVFVPRGGQVVALAASTGVTVWSSDLTDLGGTRLQKVNPMVAEGVLVVSTAQGTAALEATSGRRLWSVPRHGVRAIYGSSVYLLADEYYVHDLRSGAVVHRWDLAREMRSYSPGGGGSQLTTGLSVSETHAYVGDASGRLWAFERETGHAAWSHRPKGATGYGAAVPVICNDRLYIRSFSMDPRRPPNLYCYAGAASEAC